MLTLEMAINKIRQLTPEKQKQVFQFIEFLDEREDPDFLAIAGIWEEREITKESLRQEAWKKPNR